MAIPFYGFPVTDINGQFGNGIYKMTKGVPVLDHRVLRPQKRHDKAYVPNKCACQSFKYLDLIFQGFSQTQKDIWRNAVKRKGLSGYTLFMSEGMALHTKGKNFSGVPSISGGYSSDKALEGNVYPAPIACVMDNYSESCLLECNTWLEYWYSLLPPSYTDQWDEAVGVPGWTGLDLFKYEGLYYWGIGSYHRIHPHTRGTGTPPLCPMPWWEDMGHTGRPCNPPFYDWCHEFP